MLCTSIIFIINIIEITLEEKQKDGLITQNLYVIEQTHIDDIVIWQNEKGEIFQSSATTAPKKIANSFLSYLEIDDFED